MCEREKIVELHRGKREMREKDNYENKIAGQTVQKLSGVISMDESQVEKFNEMLRLLGELHKGVRFYKPESMVQGNKIINYLAIAAENEKKYERGQHSYFSITTKDGTKLYPKFRFEKKSDRGTDIIGNYTVGGGISGSRDKWNNLVFDIASVVNVLYEVTTTNGKSGEKLSDETIDAIASLQSDVKDLIGALETKMEKWFQSTQDVVSAESSRTIDYVNISAKDTVDAINAHVDKRIYEIIPLLTTDSRNTAEDRTVPTRTESHTHIETADEKSTEKAVPPSLRTALSTSIGKESYKNNSSLTTVTIPDGIEIIGESAFEGCRNLQSVTIPDSVKTIEKSAFFNCSALTRVEFGHGLCQICAGAFACCSALSKIKLPSSVKQIGAGAFLYCNNLKSVELECSTGWYISTKKVDFTFKPVVNNDLDNPRCAATYFKSTYVKCYWKRH